MKAFDNFNDMPPEFWAFIKFVGDKAGYCLRKTRTNPDSTVKTFTYEELSELANANGLTIPESILASAVEYTQLRAEVLNNHVRSSLMTGEEAEALYNSFAEEHEDDGLVCKIPRNLQSGEKNKTSYFTALINMITELHIKHNTALWQADNPGFDCDPHSLTFILDPEEKTLLGACSRRFDGAFPGTMNPQMIWEIKEYYYTTSFGSRIADGVYETELDGFELNEIYHRTGKKVYHVLLVDAYYTWWCMGRSYLCRIIDALNSGLVDEVIFGRDIMTRWPEVLMEQIR